MRKAIDKYQMPFIHNTDLKGWNSHITEKYVVNVKGYLLQEELADLLKK